MTLFFLIVVHLTTLFFSFEADAAQSHSICLNMIVKNESNVIRRSLESVKSLIDYWVIVDTGSEDGTQQLIQEILCDIPGELHQCPWVDFAYNRNQAMSLAMDKADYLLFLDSDDEVVFSEGFALPPLEQDLYYANMIRGSRQYKNVMFMKTHINAEWRGVLHEYLHFPSERSHAVLDKLVIYSRQEGARSQDPLKFKKDALILEEALKKEPANSRYFFYLAQSYRDSGQYSLSLEYYEKRAKMGGWDEEVFWSLYQMAMLKQYLNTNPNVFIEAYYKAFAFRPSRAEPLYYLANYYRSIGKYYEGYCLAKYGLTLKMPDEMLFVDKWVYDWGLQTEKLICSWYVGNYDEALAAALCILDVPHAPLQLRQDVEHQLQLIYEKLAFR